MIPVTPYIETIGTADYKHFLNQPFHHELLAITYGDKTEPLFDAWRGKFMNSWYKYTNEDEVVLEFYAQYYNVQSGKLDNVQRLPLPKTINDFINDMLRLEIVLYWKPIIDVKFEPKDYLPVAEISQYYVKLLASMEKSHELNL